MRIRIRAADHDLETGLEILRASASNYGIIQTKY